MNDKMGEFQEQIYPGWSNPEPEAGKRTFLVSSETQRGFNIARAVRPPEVDARIAMIHTEGRASLERSGFLLHERDHPTETMPAGPVDIEAEAPLSEGEIRTVVSTPIEPFVMEQSDIILNGGIVFEDDEDFASAGV